MTDHTSIFGITIDSILPTWFGTPSNQVVFYGNSFSYDINAIDNIGIHNYVINDTKHFTIDNDGTITNQTILEQGDYWIIVRAYNEYYNYCEEIIRITVTVDTGGKDNNIPGYDLIVIAISSFNLIIAIMLFKKRKFN
ncbi:MAG: hypothetical protein JXA99_06830 [Candidatus Lokiarchaeota archaeon]|nr:hypothetical protein [Candidatus Lokiarchaeota archaeon]